MPSVALDERLVRDSYPVTELPLCQLRLMDDSRFPWLILIPRREGVSEVFDLDEADQQQLWREAGEVGRMLKALTRADKINVANLGNVVAQLHVHVVARLRDDDAWPGPIWGQGQPQPYDLNGLASMRDHLLAQLDGLKQRL
ncbi:HIT domain-containing protein [Halomonas sp. MCCC 1A17488]|uniref:HIT domain-containing protein n=1 Tax=Billgrantia sulfidoxydans TaxID=2733484 RepID=A0ABX7W9M9_9GAMM|nr:MULTISPECIES: HIT family protein [Halomonas]MCE8018359.1 HIT domain-containing protein [Halomonas sp. MCCC 1A17488]MCG3241692.1 HIT domain-containing protein [Halomonas sp. MCCC 1A17488]QPP49278.1 HIT domain-containing protein [Halomonas sp. SS10-MC5]QTP56636.1 HIT domain-containing protein [Halomonas sulfidoxydans]